MGGPAKRIPWLVAWLLVLPTIVAAQTTYYQVEGTIDSLDKVKGVMDVGSTKGITIAANTKISRAGAPASLADLATGLAVSVRVLDSRTWLQVGTTRQESFTRRAVAVDIRGGVALPAETGSPGSRTSPGAGDPSTPYADKAKSVDEFYNKSFSSTDGRVLVALIVGARDATTGALAEPETLIVRVDPKFVVDEATSCAQASEDGRRLLFTLSRRIRREGLPTLEIRQTDFTLLTPHQTSETQGLPPCLFE